MVVTVKEVGCLIRNQWHAISFGCLNSTPQLPSEVASLTDPGRRRTDLQKFPVARREVSGRGGKLGDLP
jgi:hypothetical protein